MDKTQGGGAHASTAAKKRRKRRKKKQGEQHDQAAQSGGMSVEHARQVGSTASGVNQLVQKLKAHGAFSTEQIESCMNDMFEKGLAYDNFDAVLAQLRSEETQMKQETSPNQAAPNGSVNQHSEPEIAICESEEPPVVCPPDENGEKRDWAEPAQPVPAKSQEEIIESLLNDKNNLDSVLDGLIIWLSSASPVAKQQFINSNSLDKVLESLLENASAAETFSQASLTSLDRRLCEMLSQLFSLGMKDGLAKQSLSKGVEALKGIIAYSRRLSSMSAPGATDAKSSKSIEVKDLARLMSSVIKDSFRSKHQQANGQTFARKGNSFSDLSMEADVLDKDVIALAPRGDAVQLNNTGKLTTGDVKRLFKLRDKSNRAAKSSMSCYDLVQNADEDASTLYSRPTLDISPEVAGIVSEVETRASEFAEKSKELEQTLSATKGKTPLELQPLQQEKSKLEEEAQVLRSELEALMKRAEEVRELLEGKEAELSKCDEDMCEKTSALEKAEKDAQKNLTRHLSEVQRVEIEKKVSLELQNLATAVVRASSGLGPASLDDPERDTRVSKAKLHQQWRLRSIMSIDRYMGVEAKCIEFMRERVRKTTMDAVELEKQRQNTIAIPTLQEKTNAMLAKLQSNITEDENTVNFLLDQARSVLGKVQTLVDPDLDSDRTIAAALLRISQNALTMGLSDCFQYDAPAIEKAQTTATKPSVTTWGGWGKKNNAAPVAKSLVQIQKEEEEQLQSQSQSQPLDQAAAASQGEAQVEEKEEQAAEHQQSKTPATQEKVAAKEDTTAAPFEQTVKSTGVPNGHAGLHATEQTS